MKEVLSGVWNMPKEEFITQILTGIYIGLVIVGVVYILIGVYFYYKTRF